MPNDYSALRTLFSVSYAQTMHNKSCTIITLTSKVPPQDLYPMYSMVHQDKLVVLHSTPSKLVVTVVQQLVLKNGLHFPKVKRKG